MVTKRLVEIAERTVELALKHKANQAQVAAFLVDSALTRYANSQIHQNVASKRGGVAIKVIVDKRIGTLQVNSLEKKQIEEAVKKAVKIAKVTPQNKDFKSLPKPAKWTPIKGVFDKKTAECTPDLRAEKVKEAIETAHSKSRLVKAVAGSLSTGSFAFAVSNSLGVSAWAKISSTSLQTTVISKSRSSQGFGSAEQHSRQIKDIAPAKIGSQAAEKSIKSINPKKIPIGEYEVVLSPRAVATLFMYLGYIGFSATTYQDGQSFVKYNLNKQIFDTKLNVKDDPRDKKTLYSFPIDGEGVPKKKIHLIEKGKVSTKSICYDSFTAGKEKGKKSTGHDIWILWQTDALQHPNSLWQRLYRRNDRGNSTWHFCNKIPLHQPSGADKSYSHRTNKRRHFSHQKRRNHQACNEPAIYRQHALGSKRNFNDWKRARNSGRSHRASNEA